MRQRIVGERRCSIGHIRRAVEDLHGRVCTVDLLGRVDSRRVVVRVAVERCYYRISAHHAAEYLHVRRCCRQAVVG